MDACYLHDVHRETHSNAFKEANKADRWRRYRECLSNDRHNSRVSSETPETRIFLSKEARLGDEESG